ncbi:hypothetical protein GCM10020000_49160 [Streptomyces olivoverticillatus]
MNDWPEGRTQDRRERYGRGSTGTEPDGVRTMPHVRRTPPQQYRPPEGYDSPGGPDRDGYSTGRVYGPGGPSGGGEPHGRGRPRRTGAPNWRRRIKIGAIVFITALLAVSVSTYFWADSKMRREVDLGQVEDRPLGRAGHELPHRGLRQPRGPLGSGQEGTAHRVGGGQAHRLDDDPAHR